ncbi:MAG TPA: IS1595 family transposase, partial [Bacteroidetes bacterium]|nr:IS1595 family transposase [Bacteroidota bacterium]
HHQAKHLQPYLDEFTWRFNNRNNPNLFDILISSMMKEKATPIKLLNFY